MAEKVLNDTEINEVNDLNNQFVGFIRIKNLDKKYTITIEEIK